MSARNDMVNTMLGRQLEAAVRSLPKMSDAERKLRNARAVVVQAHPFFGALLLNQKVVETRKIPTCATDGTHLYFNPDWVLATPNDELQGTCAHEALHPGFCHHTRRGNRNPRLWNEACVRGSTRVRMANGSLRRIDRIAAGDVLASPTGPNVVGKVTISKPKAVLELHFEHERIYCSEEHRFLTARGWVRADEIAEGEAVALDPGVPGVRRGALQDHDDQGASGSNWENLPADRLVPVQLRALRRAEAGEAQLALATLGAEADRLGIYRRDRGRRGNARSGIATGQVPAAVRGDLDDDAGLGGVLRTVRVLRNNLAQQLGSLVLAGDGIGLLDHGVRAADAALPTHQARARRAARRAVRAAAIRSVAEWLAPRDAAARARDLFETAGLESTRLTSRRRLATPERLYDLATARGSYIAEGLVTHNCDLVINPILLDAGFKLPKGALYRVDCRGKNTEAVYAKLEAEQPPPSPSEPEQGDDDMDDEAKDRESEFQANGERPDDEPDDESSDESTGAGDDESSDDSDNESRSDGAGDAADDVGDVTAGSGAADASDDAGAPGDALDGGGCGWVSDAPASTEDERQDEEAKWKERMAQAAMHAAGSMPGSLRDAVNDLLNPRADWRDLLRRYMNALSKSDQSWQRQNRRFIASGTYLPAMYDETIGRVAFVCDVSGSMADGAAQRALSEVAAICTEIKPEGLDVVFFDSRVTASASYEIGDEPEVGALIPGGGGTIFNSAYDWLNERGEDYSVVVFLTDLYPNDRWEEHHVPSAPIVWIDYADGDTVPPYGDEIVRMPSEAH